MSQIDWIDYKCTNNTTYIYVHVVDLGNIFLHNYINCLGENVIILYVIIASVWEEIKFYHVTWGSEQ